jgi:hypothetical protein
VLFGAAHLNQGAVRHAGVVQNIHDALADHAADAGERTAKLSGYAVAVASALPAATIQTELS